MAVFKRGMFGRLNKTLFEIFLLLLFIFAAVKVLRIEWPF